MTSFHAAKKYPRQYFAPCPAGDKGQRFRPSSQSCLSHFLFSGLRGTFNDKHNEEIGELDILFSNLAPPGALEAPAVSSP